MVVPAQRDDRQTLTWAAIHGVPRARLLRVVSISLLFRVPSGGGGGGTAQSLKCEQCQTLLKDVSAAELHATKVCILTVRQRRALASFPGVDFPVCCHATPFAVGVFVVVARRAGCSGGDERTKAFGRGQQFKLPLPLPLLLMLLLAW